MRDDPGLRFERIFRSNADDVRAYALRRAHPDEADDVVAETFLVAWRRLDEVPEHARPWLLGVARRVLANRRRGADRFASLTVRLAEREPRRPPDGANDGVDLRLTVRRALDRLPPKEFEALTLLAWEGLTPLEAAAVVGCSRATLAVRLHRARRRLASLIDAEAIDPVDADPGPVRTNLSAKES
jgi:RNA polymerase sigma-70 factor, ECF subfamily